MSPEPKPTKLNLTPEEIATLEREKKELLQGLGHKAAAREATPAARAHQLENAALPQRKTVSVEQAERTEQEIADRIATLNAEIETLRREEIRRKQQAARDEVTKKKELGQEQAAAAEQALEAKLAAAVAGTDAMIAEFEAHRAANAAIASGGLAAKQEATRAVLQPLIKQAQATRQAMRVIRREFETMLQTLAAVTWKELDPTWPLKVRVKFEADVARKAEELLLLIGTVEALSPQYSGAGDLIATAEFAIQQGGLPGEMADLAMNLANAGSPDHITYIRREISVLLDRKTQLEETGRLQASAPATIRIDLTAGERLDRKREAMTKGLKSSRQDQAVIHEAGERF